MSGVPIPDGEAILDERNVALIGPMGVGKSAVARLLGDWLSRQVVDTDVLVEQATGKRIAEIFESDGEAAFRALEADAITAIAERTHLVVACGGGAVVDPANAEALRSSAHVVRLHGDPAVLAGRVEAGRRSGRRPLLAGDGDPEERLAALIAEREPAYAAAAHVCVEVGDRPVEAVAADVLRALEDRVREGP